MSIKRFIRSFFPTPTSKTTNPEREKALKESCMPSIYANISKMLYEGARVRTVALTGCMAHVRTNPQEGTVIGFEKFKNAGMPTSGRDYLVQIELDSGEVVKKPADPHEWQMYDGLPEYSY